MSDVLADYSQLGLTPDEMLQANKDMYARALKGANAAISMPATMVAPDLHLTDMTGGPKALNYIPFTGAVEGAVGLGGAILNAGSDLGNLVTQRYGLTIPRVPTGAAEHFEATRSAIKDKIGEYTPLPAPDMNDVADRYTDLGGSLLGSLVPIVPGGLAAAMPRGLQTVTGFLGPTASHIPQNAAIVSGLGLVGATGLAAKDARAESKANAVGSGFNDFLKQPDAPAPVPTSPGPTATQPLAATPPPVDINTGLNAALSGQDKPPAPTFEASQGPSSDTVLDTLFTIGGVLTAVGIAKYTHSIRGAATSADRNARFTNPAYAQAAQDYNNSVIARGGSIAPEGLDTATPPPLPEANKFRQATNAANTQVLDQNAQMMDAIRAIGEPSTSEKIAHMYGNTHTDASHEVRLDTFLRTGLDEKSGVRIPPPADLFRDIANLNEEQQNRLNIGLNSKNELDNRNNNARLFRQQNPGKTPTADDIRHDFKDFDDQQLRIEAAKMDNDPLLAGLAQRFRGITNGQLDIGQAHGFFPATEVANLKATHPNYVPEVGPGGETLHPFGARPTGVMAGVSNVNSRAWYNLAQHIEELHHQFELNASNRDLWQTQKDAQRQFPNSAQFMTEVKPTNTAYSFYGNEMGTFREPIVAIRTDTGPKYVRVDHPDFYNAMTGDSIKKRQIARDLLTIPRRLYQQGTTGAVSALTGRLYPPVNAGYTSMLMATNAPHNMYGGLLDKGVQRLTGQTSSLARGVDMVTNLPYVAGSYLRGVADRRVNNIADLLRPDRVPDQGAIAGFFSQRLQPLLGNATVQSLQQSMKDYYLNSTTNKIRAMGIGGQGTPIKSDLPALNIQGSKQARLVAARTVPELFFSGKWMGSKPFLLRLNRVIQEAMTNMSDAGHDAFARLNYNNPNISKETLAYETRQLTGDPGTHGASAIVKGISGVLPYTNISAQGIARFGRAIAGGHATMTMATGLGTLALASILTHMRSPEHMDYLENEVGTQARAGNLILGTNADPHKPTIVALPQELRAAYAYALDLVSKGINVLAAHHDPDIRSNVVDAIKDFLGRNVANSSEDAMLHGAIDAAGILNLPPYAGQFDYSKVLHGKSLFDSYRGPIPGDKHLPNQVPDGVLEDKNGKVWSKIIGNIFGMVGAGIASGTDTLSRYAKQTGSWADALGMVGHDWVQGFQDKNPQFNTLFENAIRLSTQPPIVEHMQRKLDAIEKITGSRTEERNEGRTGAGRYGLAVPDTQEHKIPPPTSPIARQMYQVTDAYRSRLSGPLDEINNIRKQMGAVDQQGMDVVKRREWMNGKTRELADKYRVIGGYVADLEHMLSRIAQKPIKVEDLDFTKGDEQFK